MAVCGARQCYLPTDDNRKGEFALYEALAQKDCPSCFVQQVRESTHPTHEETGQEWPYNSVMQKPEQLRMPVETRQVPLCAAYCKIKSPIRAFHCESLSPNGKD